MAHSATFGINDDGDILDGDVSGVGLHEDTDSLA